MSLDELHDSLDAALSGPDPNFDAPPDLPDSVYQVDEILSRLIGLDNKTREVVNIANARRGVIDMWETEQLDAINTQRVWCENSLAIYHRWRLTQDESAKTLSFPHGTLKSTKQQPEWVYTKVEEFLAWAQENATDLVRVPEPTPAPDKDTVKRTLVIPGKPKVGDTVRPTTAEGELVPGVEVHIREPKYTIVLDQ